MTPLQDEILNGPLSQELLQYVESGDDGKIFEILNRNDISVNSKIYVNTFVIFVTKNGLRSKIEDTSIDISCPVRDVSLSLLDFLKKGNDAFIDFSIQDIVNMMSVWLNYIGKPELESDILELSKKKISRSNQLSEIGIDVTIENIAQGLRG